MTYILKTHHLSKSFNQVEVISDMNINIRKGEIYGFIGPNGSGKTTVMKMIVNLLKPTHGEIEIFNEKLTPSSYEMLKRIGSMIDYPIFYENLSVSENLSLHAEYMGFHQKTAVEESLELVHLKKEKNQIVKNLSLGMKQRLGIARALLTKPELMILDEPMNSLDPESTHQIRDLFFQLKQTYDITLLISSHLLGELEKIVDTIGIIKDGKLIQEASMSHLKAQNTEYIELTTPTPEKVTYILEEKLNIYHFKVLQSGVIQIFDPVSQNDLFKTMILNDIIIESISNKHASLEDHFLQLVGGLEND